MVWIVLLGLGLWCVFQHNRIADLAGQLKSLKIDVDRALRTQSEQAQPAPSATAVEEPLPSAHPVVSPISSSTAPAPQAVQSEIPIPAPQSPEPSSTEHLASRTPSQIQYGPSLSDWLSKNGLAWIGGGALALGGLMLVAYAAEHGFFTPLLRIWSAVALGMAALVVGEGLRRFRTTGENGSALVAALTTAAGAAILYAAAWAAYVLYGFIPAPAAAVLLTAISLGLIALALLHGEALGLLAIVGAFAVPIVSGGGAWGGAAVDAFLVLVMAVGLATAGLRRWFWTGAIALGGAGLWGLTRLVEVDFTGAMAIIIAAPFLALAAGFAASRGNGSVREAALDAWWLPSGAVVGASLMALVLWARALESVSPLYGGVSLAAVASAAALGLRLRLLPGRLLAAPAFAVVLVAILCNLGRRDAHELPWLVTDIAAVAIAAFIGSDGVQKSRLAAILGASGAALALTLSAPLLASGWPRWGVIVDLAFGVLFALGVKGLASKSSAPNEDLTLAAWIGASAEAAGLAIHAGVDGRLAPTAYGLLGALLAILALRARWRGFAEAAPIACLASFAALLATELAAAFTGAQTWILIGAVALGAALAQLVVWRVLLSARIAAGLAEAASTLAILSGLTGCFLVLQRWHVAGAGAPALIDGFTTASLRTILILAAGLILAIRGASTQFGRWRAPVFLAVGAVHGLLFEALVLHPWWGAAAPVLGPPLADTIMIGLLIPTPLLAFSASRLAREQRGFIGPAILAALAFLIVWMITELRRLFHGAVLTVGEFGYAEVAAYGLCLAGLGVGLNVAKTRLSGILREQRVVDQAVSWANWAGLAIGAMTFDYFASPWWGPLAGELQAPALLWFLYAVACGCSCVIALFARKRDQAALSRAAVSVTGSQVFALITLLVRYAFHGAAMRAALREASLETWTFSAVWALYGLSVLAVGASRKDIALRGLGLTVLLATTAKVFLFDMATLQGVVRAASFLALGTVLLAGALAARRLGVAASQQQ